jgi:uncharacterized protein (DUF1684 family)
VTADPRDVLDVLDWRRRVFALYADVRATPDPQNAWKLWRDGRDELFATHPASPLDARAGFAGLPYAAYDPACRFTVRVAPAEPASIHIATTDAGGVRLDRVGRVELPIGGLDVWSIAGYGGGIFVPLADASNGTSTYGGGRYLLDTSKGADLGSNGSDLVIDLNFAYHPSCRYSPRWVCPLAPPGNRLAVAVRAGELMSPGG